MRKLRDSSGLTLLEVVFAMGILSIALAGLATAFPVSRIAVFQGGQYTTAANVGQDALERVKRVGFANIPPAGDISGNALFGAAPAGYVRQVIVEDVAFDAGVRTAARVTVNVTFIVQGQAATATLSTIFAL